MTLTTLALALVLSSPADSKLTTIDFHPSDRGGAIVCLWTPNKDASVTDGFRHFVRSGPVTARMYYEQSYADTKMGLSLARGSYALATGKYRPAGWSTVTVVPGMTHFLVWTWMKRGQDVEMACYFDWKLVSYDCDAGKPLKLWKTTNARAGARDLRPGRPEYHTCTGVLSAWAIRFTD